MITPKQVEDKKFSKVMRGFSPEEVDEFLDEIILTMESMINENNALKIQVSNLQDDLASYKRSETSMLNTLESAKKLMTDISESAEKRAEIIVHNARLEADVIQKDARDSVIKLTEEGERLRNMVDGFKEKYRRLLENELTQLDGSSEDLFAELEREFGASKASKKEKAVFPAEDMKIYNPEAVAADQAEEVSDEAEAETASANTLVIDKDAVDKMLKENLGFDGKAETDTEAEAADEIVSEEADQEKADDGDQDQDQVASDLRKTIVL